MNALKWTWRYRRNGRGEGHSIWRQDVPEIPKPVERCVSIRWIHILSKWKAAFFFFTKLSRVWNASHLLPTVWGPDDSDLYELTNDTNLYDDASDPLYDFQAIRNHRYCTLTDWLVGALHTDGDDYYCNFSGKGQRSNRFEVRFRTSSDNGLILWLSRGHSLQADYLSLAIVHSRLELSFNLGKQSTFLTARSMVNIGIFPFAFLTLTYCYRSRWISVTETGILWSLSERNDLEWSMLMARNLFASQPIPVRRSSIATESCGLVHLITFIGQGFVLICVLITGGSASLPHGLPSPYYDGFVGCIDQIKVDRHQLDWHRHGDNAYLHYCDGA